MLDEATSVWHEYLKESYIYRNHMTARFKTNLKIISYQNKIYIRCIFFNLKLRGFKLYTL